MKKSEQKIKWYMLGFMCFSTLWGFGNVVNGFVFFNGTQVIFSWILMFLAICFYGRRNGISI